MNVVYRVKAVMAWQAFAATPNRTTAVALVGTMPPVRKYFIECSPSGRFYETERVLRRHQ